jgi:hypothetical protein
MAKEGYDYSRVTIAELKEFLDNEGFDVSALDGKRKAEIIQAIDDVGLLSKLDAQLFGPVLAGAELIDDEQLDYPALMSMNKSDTRPAVPTTPERGTKAWNDYVLAQFNDDERVEYNTQEGRKIDAVRADGLRRVGQLVLGDVLFSGPVEQHIDYNGLKGLPCAWVKYRIVVKDVLGRIQEYMSLGDVSYLNTENSFLAFALATAETRAKGRAWREALGVKTYALEEFSGKKNTADAVEEITSADWDDGPITGAQIRSIRSRCNLLGISVFKFLNCQSKDGVLTFDPKKVRLSGIEDEMFTKKRAASAFNVLNDIQQGNLKIDTSLKEDE